MPPDRPTYRSEDVSVIVPTIDTEVSFTECIRLLLANHPKEIIVVTVPWNLNRVRRLIEPRQLEHIGQKSKIRIFTVNRASKREQVMRGIEASTGKILALVDDDTFWPQPMVLSYLLVPFEDPTVGGSTGTQR